MRDALFLAVLAASLAIAFSVGRMYGIRQAPEYTARQDRLDAEMDADMARLDAEYRGSRNSVCDQIFDLVTDRITQDSRPPERR